MMSSPDVTVYKILNKLDRELTEENSDSRKKVTKILSGLHRGGREALKMIPGVNVAVGMENMPTDLLFKENEISVSELREEIHRAVKNGYMKRINWEG